MQIDVNPYKVPRRTWRRWSPVARRVFCEVYDSMQVGGALLFHTHTRDMLDADHKIGGGPVTVADQVSVIAWNAAWQAAEEAHALRLGFTQDVDDFEPESKT